MNTATRTQTVANSVSAALKAEGYTLTHTAAKLGVSKSQASRLLAGKSDFKFAHLVTIGKFLNVSPNSFLGLETTAEDNYLTVGEAAAFARKHPETIRKNIHAGYLKSVQKMPRGWHLVRESDLRAWLAGAR